jgi:3-oxoacyl-[acyl-carrier protein] reductase
MSGRPANWPVSVRNVIVTGGSRGLGLSIAQMLAGAGYRVIAIARSESEELASAVTKVVGAGQLHFRRFDLANVTGIPDLVTELRQEFRSIYGLVNNAGLGTSGVLATMRDAEIERLVQLNTLSPIVLSKYAVRSMMAHGEGCIVNIASIAGFTGYQGLSAYSATKASLIGFTRSLAREVGTLGIRVNAVAPGFIDTAMTRSLDARQRQRITHRAAMHRLADADDVANAVQFLMSDQARSITGTVMTVDAGSTA